MLMTLLITACLPAALELLCLHARKAMEEDRRILSINIVLYNSWEKNLICDLPVLEEIKTLINNKSSIMK